MQIQETVTYDREAIDALADMSMQTKDKKLIRLILCLASLAFLLVGVYYLVNKDYMQAMTYGVGTLLILTLTFRVIPKNVRKSIMQSSEKLLDKPMLYAINEEGISLVTSFANVHYDWSQTADLLLSGDFYGILLQNKSVILLKKDSLTSDELAWIKKQIAA